MSTRLPGIIRSGMARSLADAPDAQGRKKRRRHDLIKGLRATGELGVLILLAVLIIRALFTFQTYEPFDPSQTVSRKGFVAVSYFGVDRNGDETLISTRRLEEHMAALERQGFVTITQDDIAAYYREGTPLPEKALFLMFEDGRRDTAIFAQQILEQHNYKGSIMTYAEKFQEDDPKFLRAKDVQELLDSGFWETGTNGFRLAYINVRDRYENYLGNLSTLEYAMITDYLSRDYNHYLMDYIRDSNDIPLESYQEMEARISADYKALEWQYTQSLGQVPELYVLMHANTGQFGNNGRVSEVNAQWIYDLFSMNFNREGSCWNTAAGTEDECYDLTRMQPQSYWYSNHLLMRILCDSGLETEFIRGDEGKWAEWSIQRGALECREEQLVLTSEADGEGKALLQAGDAWQDFELTTTLTGNVFGEQALYLRAGDGLGQGIMVSVRNNVLYVEENGAQLLELPLDELDGVAYRSVDEDENDARIAELSALQRYAPDVETAAYYNAQLQEEKSRTPAAVSDGAEAYVPEIEINELGNRELRIRLEGPSLSIWVDGKPAAEGLPVTVTGAGRIGLGSRWGGFGWSQRNLADDVYDGVFEKLTVTTLPDEDGNTRVLWDNCLHGWDAAAHRAGQVWDSVINWFITHL